MNGGIKRKRENQTEYEEGGNRTATKMASKTALGCCEGEGTNMKRKQRTQTDRSKQTTHSSEIGNQNGISKFHLM